MVIVNSYSSTPEEPRWRVFIPTTIAMPIAVYKAIAEQIMRTLNRDGYWSKKQLEANERIKSRKHHGFDMGKLTPSSLFYLPCQAEHSGDSFFIDHNSSGRLPLDPYIWADYAANHHRSSPEPSQAGAATVTPTVVPMPATDCHRLRRMRELLAEEAAAKVQNDRAQHQAAAIERWRGALPGDGNRAFFQLAVDLRSAGMSEREIEDALDVEAGHARHRAERRRQIKSIMRTLRASSRRLAA
jgi:hypothetical protein